jgi:CHAT domain-containing protein/Tfp pilus assembly protein PilF
MKRSPLAAAAVLLALGVWTAARPSPLAASAPSPNDALAKARSLYALGDYAGTQALLQSRASAWDAAGDASAALSAYDILTQSLWSSGQVEAAVQAAQKARALAERLGRADVSRLAAARLEIIALYKKAKALRDESMDNAASAAVFEQAVALARGIEAPEFEAKCLRQQSVAYYQMEDYAAFRDLNRKALEITLKAKNRRDEGVCRNNLAVYYLKIDDYTEALAQVEIALEIARAASDDANAADGLNNLALIYAELGDFDKAAKAQTDALELERRLGDPVKIGIRINNLGIIHRRKGLITDDRREFELAARAFEEALARLEGSPETESTARVLNNLGSTWSQLGEFDKALDRFRASLALAEKIGSRELRGSVLNNIGIVYARLGELERSTVYYRQAVDLALEQADKKSLWETYLELGNAQRGLGRDREAAESYRAAIAIIEEIRASISTEELRATYFGSDKRLDAYHNLIGLLVDVDGDPAPADARAAFETLEKARARSFLDSLEVRAYMNERPAGAPALAEREKALLGRLSQAYRELLRPGLEGLGRSAVQARIEAAEEDLDRLRRDMRRADPVLAGLEHPAAITYDQARAALPDARTTAIAFAVGKEKAYAFALSRTGLKVYPIPPPAVLRSEVETHIRRISDADSASFDEGVALYKALIEPGLAPGVAKLIIIPDGILTYLPFEALPTSRDAPVHWLVQDLEVSYAPSLSSYRELRGRAGRTHARTRPSLLAVGAPSYASPDKEREAAKLIESLYPELGTPSLALPFAAREIERAAASFPARRRTVLTGPAASDDALKARATDRNRIIHLAAHGLIDDRKPMRSAIVMAAPTAPDGDYLLQTREILDLRLDADLVVLSACRTGLGRFLRGEGIEGLNRAFFAAGASSVLMTLWSVSDEAGVPLMDAFYNRLLASDSIAASLRAAKLALLSSPGYAHPYYWAGYIAAGDAGRIPFPHRGRLWIGLIAGAALALLAYLLLRRARRWSPPPSPDSTGSATSGS